MAKQLKFSRTSEEEPEDTQSSGLLDVTSFSSNVYSGTPLRQGGVCLTPTAWNAVARLVDAAYSNLTFKKCMPISLNDKKVFEEKGMPPLSTSAYGELLPEGVWDLLWQVGAKPGDRFYDLGSGGGKLAMMAWFAGLRVTGIELARSRWDVSKGAVAALREMARRGEIPEGGVACSSQLPDRSAASLDYICGDALDLDFRDADIVFICSVMFPDWVMEHLASKASLLKPGSRIITFKPLGKPEFHQLGVLLEPASWKKSDCMWRIYEVLPNHLDSTEVTKYHHVHDVFGQESLCSFSDQS